MDFDQVIFGKKTFSDLLKEIYNNSRDKEKLIKDLINDLKPMVKEQGDAMLIVPLLKEYLDISVKNDEHLIKMAGIIQRAMNNANNNDGELLLSDSEKQQLFDNLTKINNN